MSDGRPAERRSFGQRLGKAIGNVLRWLLRLIFILIIGAAVGVGIYFGAIYVYQQYIAPVQVHTIRLDILEAQQDEAAERLGARVDELQERVRGLEAQRDEDKQALARLEGRVIAAETVQAAQAEGLDQVDQVRADLAALQAALAEAQGMQETLRADVDALRADQESVQAGFDTLAQDLDPLQQVLGSLGDDLRTVASELVAVQGEVDVLAKALSEQDASVAAVQDRLSGATSPEALLRSLHVVRTMELLTRSRLLLVQNNVGLARTDIAAAQDRMIELQAIAPADQQDAIEEVIARLDAALDALPGSPVAAADALEGAWQLLLGGLPSGAVVAAEAGATVAPAEGTPTVEVTPAAEGTPAAEATPTPAEVTPPVEATPTPTATPQS